MKKIILILLFLSVFSGYSQVEKDSLFAKEYAVVHQKLKLMHYLERAVMQYYTMDKYEQTASEKTFQYYLKKNLIEGNPVPTINILRYLEVYLQKDIPANWESFITRVNNTNVKSLIEITKKYGYPSRERIIRYVGLYDLPGSSISFAIRKNIYFEELKKVLKSEIKQGNISESEYKFFIDINNREVLSTKEVMKVSKGKAHFVLD